MPASPRQIMELALELSLKALGFGFRRFDPHQAPPDPQEQRRADDES
jgi:hypothetical protein